MVKISFTEKLNTIRTFNIPPIKSCPHRTDFCELYCYALKGRFNFKETKDLMNENYEDSKKEGFIEEVNNLLSINERYFRIHGAGDFYNQDYYDKWVVIAYKNPHITFMAYTRNPSIDFTRKPPNLKLLFTLDSTTKRLNPTANRFSLVGNYMLQDLEHLTKLIVDSVPYSVCNYDKCEDCLYCWTNYGNVLFPQKYKKYDVAKPLLKVKTT